MNSFLFNSGFISRTKHHKITIKNHKNHAGTREKEKQNQKVDKKDIYVDDG